VALFDEYWFAYYTAKTNYVIGALVFLLYAVADQIMHGRLSPIDTICIVLPFLIAVWTASACSLRKEMKQLTGKPTEAAHKGAYTRLKISPHGVGVFAIRDIPSGTNVFDGDTTEIREIPRTDLLDVHPEVARLYRDFCVFTGGKILGPTNFNNMTVGWYLNHSETPNMRCDDDYNFFSLHEIKAGEELTVDYHTYDDRKRLFDREEEVMA
jgi:hypothetical protein